MEEKSKEEAEAGRGSWSDEVDEEKVQKVEWDEIVEKVELDEEVQNTGKIERDKKGDQDATDEDEGMLKTTQIPWHLRQSEVQNELTDATNLAIPWKL